MTAGQLADPFDVRYAARATGLLAEFNRASVLSSADVHVATALGRLGGERDEQVVLAVALAVRAVRYGSVCVDLGQVRTTAAADTEESVDLDLLPWPVPEQWYAACAASPLVAGGVNGAPDRPVRLVDELLYLDRYWRQERLVRAELDARAGCRPTAVDSGRLRAALDRLFPDAAPDYQRLAATTLMEPRMQAAAARLQEAVAEESAHLGSQGLTPPGPLTASTRRRLLGSRPGSHGRFKHDRTNRLAFDVVIVDETSMVSLTLMSRLLEAVRPDARLVLVGDPDQLASVEAGAVLVDLVHRPARSCPDARSELLASLLPDDVALSGEVERELRNDVVRLRTTYRFGGKIAELAAAIRAGDPDDALAVLRSGAADVHFVETAEVGTRSPAGLEGLRADVTSAGTALTDAARAGDLPRARAALERHRLLCAHRQGPYGVARWSAEIEQWLTAAIDGYAAEGEWYRGRPLVVTANDYELKLYNGDTGVVVDGGPRGPLAAFGRGTGTVLLAPSRLSGIQTVHAMTIHRGQGSQFERGSVLLPPADSPLLTRELFYTAVTRAKEFVRVIGTEDAVRRAVTPPVVRASGLRRRLPS